MAAGLHSSARYAATASVRGLLVAEIQVLVPYRIHPSIHIREAVSLSLSMRRSLAFRLREAGVTESAARELARQPAPVPQDPDRAFDAPESA